MMAEEPENTEAAVAEHTDDNVTVADPEPQPAEEAVNIEEAAASGDDGVAASENDTPQETEGETADKADNKEIAERPQDGDGAQGSALNSKEEEHLPREDTSGEKADPEEDGTASVEQQERAVDEGEGSNEIGGENPPSDSPDSSNDATERPEGTAETKASPKGSSADTETTEEPETREDGEDNKEGETILKHEEDKQEQPQDKGDVDDTMEDDTELPSTENIDNVSDRDNTDEPPVTDVEAIGEPAESKKDITSEEENPEAIASRRESSNPSPKNTPVTIITVKTGEKEIKVEIHPPTSKKPFLGGWRNKNTGVEYHNCSTQTYKRTRAFDGKEKFHRVTQTQELSSGQTNHQQTDKETATQMTFNGVYVTTKTDKIIQPKNYETAADRFIRMTNHVIVIQKWYRRWSAGKYVGALRQQRQMLREWEFSEQERKVEEVEAEHHSKIMRRLNPKTKEDFDLLYAGLEAWHKEQREKINKMDSLERKAAKVMLLKQETNYLASIDRLKQAASTQNRERRVAKFLDDAAAPKEWVDPMYEKVNTMETPATIRARELKEVYNSFKQWGISTDERLDVLLKVKQVVQDYKTKLTKDIIGLLNREADLIMRGTKAKNLEGLRKRSLNLFLQFVETPEFNPEAARLLPVHKKPEELQKDVHLCRGCGRYLSATEFEVSPLMKTMGKCKQCMKMANYATKREDKTQIRRILDDVRLNELAFNDFSQTAFLMTTDDVKLLVQNIWGARSALSQHDDITDLRLIRWDSTREFSPENCILLTKDEAVSHDALTTLDGTYGRNFVAKIHQRHIQGRNKFSKLLAQSSVARKKAIEKKRQMEVMATGQQATE